MATASSLVFSSTVMLPAASPISFSQEIAPIFVKKCVNCHGPEKVKGGFRLHTFEWLLKKGESERTPVEPGHPEQSELMARLTTTDETDRMPQKDDPLPSADIERIRQWIAEGALFDGTDRQAELQSLLPPEVLPVAPKVYARAIPILALAFKPDDRSLAAAGYHEVTLWNPMNGALSGRWGLLPERVHSLAFSSDGAWLAVGGGAPGQYGEVVLLDAKDGHVVQRLGRTRDVVLAVAFAPDGRFVVAGGADNCIRVYDWPAGKERLVIQQHADWVLAVAVDREGKHLASGSRDGTARVYATDTGELLATHHDHHASVWGVSFGVKPEPVVSAGADKEVHFWTLAEGKQTAELKGWPSEVYRLLVHDDFVFGAGSVVRQYTLGDRKLVREFSGNQETVYGLAYNDSTHLLAAGCYDGQVYVWNASDGMAVTNFAAWPR